jgi:hypothetical protein
VRVPQCDLAPVRNDGGLAAYEGAQAAVQARLELAGHERVVGARLGQQPEVQLEQAQVEDDGDGRQHHATHLEKSFMNQTQRNNRNSILRGVKKHITNSK